MYNQSVKAAMLQQLSDKGASTIRFKKLFAHIEQFEIDAGKDVCAMSVQELQRVADSIKGFRATSVGQLTTLREYIEWCVAHKVEGAHNCFEQIDTSNLEKMRTKTVVSPRQLQVYLDALFDPESECGIDNTYRVYYWLAYAGVAEEDFIDVTVQQIDLNTMTIMYKGRELPIYREALPCFRNSVELTYFRRINPKNGKMTDYNRIEGDSIFRGIRTNPIKTTIKTAIKFARKNALEAGKTTKVLSYTSTFYSGIYYRMYEDERAGLPINPFKIAEEITADKEYTDKYNATMRVKRDLVGDYEIWKLTF